MANRIARLALLATALIASPAAAQTVGVNAAVINDVRMTTDANRTLHKAAVKERVSLNNDILTGRASRLQVLLLDRTTFTVGQNARIKVDRFVYDPARRASSVGLTVARGAFRFLSGKATKANPGQSGIRTPIASIGIRGTIVEGVVGPEAMAIMGEQTNVTGYQADPETASLIVLRGPGDGVAGEEPGAIDVTSGGTTVTLDQPGMAVFVPREGAPPIAFRIWLCGATMLVDLLRNPSYRMQQSDNPVPSNPVTGSDARFEVPVRQVPVPNPRPGPGQGPGQNPVIGGPSVGGPGGDPLLRPMLAPRI